MFISITLLKEYTKRDEVSNAKMVDHYISCNEVQHTYDELGLPILYVLLAKASLTVI